MGFYLTDEDYAIAEKNGIDKASAYRRFYLNGWTLERTITQPVNRQKSLKQILEKDYPDYESILKENEVSYATFYQRIYYGSSIEEALYTPNKRLHPSYAKEKRCRVARKITKEQFAIAEENGIKYGTVRARVYNYHWPVEKAITISTDYAKGRRYNQFKKEI